ncbi:hypothetical protein [Sphingomonas beigongshangi]|uniref:hypothetical protein n=1 Tax=Sphingomonas beigongshangi TaxID=2782540 RepID=UPI00193C50AD|nr:hypothetical protein [Sphingomonas beigongshangi]
MHSTKVELLPFQARVQPWMMACFGEMIAGDREERNHRFLEEALELVQSLGCTSSEAHQLVDYVYGRDVGDPPQEVGGVMVTLAALCLANNLDMHANGETKLARIWTKVEAIRAKQAAKPKHSPLPMHVASSHGGEELREAAQFLSDRLDDLEWIEGDLEATLRDFMGHVDPAHARLRSLLASPPPVDRAEAIPAGMKPWHGGDCAPSDWDGGPVLLGDGRHYAANVIAGERLAWSHRGGEWAHGDIVAYTPKPAAQPLEGLTSDQTFTLAEVKKMWATAVEAGGILAGKGDGTPDRATVELCIDILRGNFGAGRGGEALQQRDDDIAILQSLLTEDAR